jgi:hypothetical protein
MNKFEIRNSKSEGFGARICAMAAVSVSGSNGTKIRRSRAARFMPHAKPQSRKGEKKTLTERAPTGVGCYLETALGASESRSAFTFAPLRLCVRLLSKKSRKALNLVPFVSGSNFEFRISNFSP